MNFKKLANFLLLGGLNLTLHAQGRIDLSLWDRPMYFDTGEGFGDVAFRITGKPGTLGLFLRGAQNPFATVPFGRGDHAPYPIPTLNPTVVPGYPPNSIAPLTVKIWMGDWPNQYAMGASVDIMAGPLGGPNGSNPPIIQPDVSTFIHDLIYLGFLEVRPNPRRDLVTLIPNRNAFISINDLLRNDFLALFPGYTNKFKVVTDSLPQEAIVVNDGTNILFQPSSLFPEHFSYQLANVFGAYTTARVDVVQLKLEALPDSTRLSFYGDGRSSYFLQGRDSIEQPWVDLPPLSQPTPGQYQLIDTNALPYRFYRVNAKE